MADQKGIKPQDAYVLIVEDSMQNVLLLSRLLDFIGVAGYEWKASGWQVLDVIEAMPRVDLILLDLHLPYEDGFETIIKIRDNPQFANTRVVAVTADASAETMQKTREAGFDGFLGKPLDSKQFPQQFADILQGNTVWSLGKNR